jgi:hypothetical protein
MNNQDGLNLGRFLQDRRVHRLTSSRSGDSFQSLPNVFILGCDLKDLSIFSSYLFPSFLILIQDTQIDSCKEAVRVDTKGLLQFKGGFPKSFSIVTDEIFF